MKPILTDAKGRPFEKPVRAQGEDVGDYLRRYHAYLDSITACANNAFEQAFSAALKGG